MWTINARSPSYKVLAVASPDPDQGNMIERARPFLGKAPAYHGQQDYSLKIYLYSFTSLFLNTILPVSISSIYIPDFMTDKSSRVLFFEVNNKSP